MQHITHKIRNNSFFDVFFLYGIVCVHPWIGLSESVFFLSKSKTVWIRVENSPQKGLYYNLETKIIKIVQFQGKNYIYMYMYYN